MSQIFATTVEGIFDGRRTKREMPIYRGKQAKINIIFDLL